MLHRHDHDEEHESDELLHQIRNILISLLDTAIDIRACVCALVPPSHQATTATISLGADMATATLTFVDASTTPPTDQPPPTGDGSGLVVTFSTSDTTVASVGPASASGDVYTATVTRVTDAAYELSAEVANTSGVPLVDNDGTTPFAQPPALSVAAVTPPPAQATTGVITLSGDAPV